jgi:hypothetical protein
VPSYRPPHERRSRPREADPWSPDSGEGQSRSVEIAIVERESERVSNQAPRAAGSSAHDRCLGALAGARERRDLGRARSIGAPVGRRAHPLALPLSSPWRRSASHRRLPHGRAWSRRPARACGPGSRAPCPCLSFLTIMTQGFEAGEYSFVLPGHDPAAFLARVEMFEAGEDPTENRVRMRGLWLLQGDRIVASRRLRHELIPVLLLDGDNIAYEVRPCEARRRGVGRELLRSTRPVASASGASCSPRRRRTAARSASSSRTAGYSPAPASRRTRVGP